MNNDSLLHLITSLIASQSQQWYLFTRYVSCHVSSSISQDRLPWSTASSVSQNEKGGGTMRSLIVAMVMAVSIGFAVPARAQTHSPLGTETSSSVPITANMVGGGLLALVTASGLLNLYEAGSLVFQGTPRWSHRGQHRIPAPGYRWHCRPGRHLRPGCLQADCRHTLWFRRACQTRHAAEPLIGELFQRAIAPLPWHLKVHAMLAFYKKTAAAVRASLTQEQPVAKPH